jgi:hypothetical protein
MLHLEGAILQFHPTLPPLWNPDVNYLRLSPLLPSRIMGGEEGETNTFWKDDNSMGAVGWDGKISAHSAPLQYLCKEKITTQVEPFHSTHCQRQWF